MPRRTQTPLAVGALVALLSVGCQCGATRLISHPGEDPTLPITALTCGNGQVDAPEECDFGLEGNTGVVGGCNPDCTLSRGCFAGEAWREELLTCVPLDAGAPSPGDAGPEDAGQAPDAGPPDAGAPDAGGTPDAGPRPDAGPVDAVLTGTIREQTPGGLYGNSVLHPKVPLPGARVHLRLPGGTSDLASELTDALGQFRFDVSSGVAYELRYTVPPAFYSEPTYHQPIRPLAPGETRIADYDFFRAGIHYTVRDAHTSAPISTVNITIRQGNVVIAGPYFTDVEGYAHFPSTAVPGDMVFEKAGYQTLRLSSASGNTSHTLIGGCILTP